MDRKVKLKRLVTEPPPKEDQKDKRKNMNNGFVKSVSFDQSYDKIIENGSLGTNGLYGSGSKRQFDSSINDKISIKYGSLGGVMNKGNSVGRNKIIRTLLR